MQKLISLSSVNGTVLVHRDNLPDYTGFDAAPTEFHSDHCIGQMVNWYPNNDLFTKIRGCSVAAVKFESNAARYSLYVPHGNDLYELIENIDGALVVNDFDAADFEDTLRLRAQSQETAALNTGAQAFIDALAITAWPHLMQDDYSDLKQPKALMTEALPYIEAQKLARPSWQRALNRLTPDINDVDEDLIKVAEKIQARLDAIKSDTNLTANDFAFVRDWQLLFRADSAPAAARMRAMVGKVVSNELAPLFVDESEVDVKSQRKHASRAASLVKRMVGREATKLTIEEAKRAREKQPGLYAEYLAARKEINAITNAAVIAVTRKFGAPVSLSDVIKSLDRDGIEHSLPKGFHGKVDERGFYTQWDEPLEGKPIGEVRMNPAYKRGALVYVFQTRAEGAKTYQTIYTKAAKTTRRDEKFAKVSDTLDNLERYQKIWRADLMGRDAELQELGCIAEILFLTASRIGTPGNETDGQATFGLTTIVGSDLTCKGTNVRIQYRGKKGSSIDYLINADDKYSRQVVKLLGEWSKAVGKRGNVFDATAKDVNDYLRTRVKLPLRSHGFRYMRGTKLMTELLDSAKSKLPKSPTERQVVQAFNAAAEQVGAVLGHTNKRADGTTNVTGSTAVKSYIDPAVSRAFFEEYNVRPPLVLEKM